ncbi:MAG: GIY-YIG nuclease family protein [Bradyrhizobium sp.]
MPVSKIAISEGNSAQSSGRSYCLASNPPAGEFNHRISELAQFRGYTASRRPVELIFSQWFDQITDAIENERKLKKWSRAKKEALIRGDFASLPKLAKRRSHHPSGRPPAAGSSG